MIKINKNSFDNFNYSEHEKLVFNIKHGLNTHPIWLNTYLNNYKYQSSLILECYEDDILIGFLPLVVKNEKDNRFFNLKKVIPCGYYPSDFFSIPVMPGKENFFAVEIAHWFNNNIKLWDRVFINLIPDVSSFWKILIEQLKQYFTIKLNKSNNFLYIDTSGSHDDYMKNLGNKKNKYLRYIQNKFERDIGKIELIHYDNELVQHLDEFLKIYSRRKKILNQINPFDKTKELKQFKKDVFQRYEKKGWVKLLILRSNDKNIAYCYYYYFNKIIYYSMPTFIDDFKKYSPGSILLNELIKTAFEDTNIYEFNFMRLEADYKKWWNPEKKKYLDISFENHRSKKIIIGNFFKNTKKVLIK